MGASKKGTMTVDPIDSHHHTPNNQPTILQESWDENAIKKAQLAFYREQRAGCYFAAVAAKDPGLYGWRQQVIEPRAEVVDEAVSRAIADSSVSTLSLIIPTVQTAAQLLDLCSALRRSRTVRLELREPFDDFLCLGYRAVVGEKRSWMTGFGPFDFFPLTRQSPHSELTLRVKPRPKYAKVMKEAPEGVLHLADLDMLGIAEAAFKTLWHKSLQHTAELLGHKPDLRSAAKTTYSLPFDLLTP